MTGEGTVNIDCSKASGGSTSCRVVFGTAVVEEEAREEGKGARTLSLLLFEAKRETDDAAAVDAAAGNASSPSESPIPPSDLLIATPFATSLSSGTLLCAT